MKKTQIAVLAASLYLLFFLVTPYIGVPEVIIYALYGFSPVVVIIMVYVVLKHGKPSKFTFDQRFYDDLDYERSGKEELDR